MINVNDCPGKTGNEIRYIPWDEIIFLFYFAVDKCEPPRKCENEKCPTSSDEVICTTRTCYLFHLTHTY